MEIPPPADKLGPNWGDGAAAEFVSGTRRRLSRDAVGILPGSHLDP
jgi:hypothetical protein